MAQSTSKKKVKIQKSTRASKTQLPARTSAELAPLQLGNTETTYEFNYDPRLLEKIQNRHPHARAWVSLICTEFTSLCPKTGQPDFAKIFINYIPNESLVESKSLKLYLFSFRNHGDFHEDCVQNICDDLAQLLKPRYLEVIGEFTPRGGIAIFPFSSVAEKTAEFQSLREERIRRYVPGSYTMPLSRLY